MFAFAFRVPFPRSVTFERSVGRYFNVKAKRRMGGVVTRWEVFAAPRLKPGHRIEVHVDYPCGVRTMSVMIVLKNGYAPTISVPPLVAFHQLGGCKHYDQAQTASVARCCSPIASVDQLGLFVTVM